MKCKEKEAMDSTFQKVMLGTLPPTNWSQISAEIPSLLVIMSHSLWDSGEDKTGEKGGRSQASVTVMLQSPLFFPFYICFPLISYLVGCLSLVNYFSFHSSILILIILKQSNPSMYKRSRVRMVGDS